MATSGSYDWTLTRDEIIARALRILGQLSEGDTASASQVTEFAEALEMIVKDLYNERIFLWGTEWITKTLTASDEVTGTDSEVYTCIRSHTSASSNKPITGADYLSYWKLTGSTGGVWATATSYSSIGDFTPDTDTRDIAQAFIRESDGTDRLLTIAPFSEYLKIHDKSITGTPDYLFLDKQLSPKVYIYEQPDSTDYIINYLKVRILEDFDSSSTNFDGPTNWLRALPWMLADEKSMDYAIPREDRLDIERKAEKFKQMAMKSDVEVVSSEFVRGAFG